MPNKRPETVKHKEFPPVKMREKRLDGSKMVTFRFDLLTLEHLDKIVRSRKSSRAVVVRDLINSTARIDSIKPAKD